MEYKVRRCSAKKKDRDNLIPRHRRGQPRLEDSHSRYFLHNGSGCWGTWRGVGLAKSCIPYLKKPHAGRKLLFLHQLFPILGGGLGMYIPTIEQVASHSFVRVVDALLMWVTDPISDDAIAIRASPTRFVTIKQAREVTKFAPRKMHIY